MDPDQLTQEEALQVWNEEATKLDAGEPSPAPESSAAAPEEVPPRQDEKTEEAQPAGEPEDPLAGLPDVVRAKLAKIDELAQVNAQLLHKVNSAEGRVAAMQRELQQAKVAQQQVAPQQSPTQGQIAGAAKNPEKWEQLKQDFPEWASAMEEYVAVQVGSVKSPSVDPQALQAYVQEQVGQTRAEMHRALEEARVEGKYENWQETVRTADFTNWFSLQPPEVQALGNSTAARDAIRVLDLFNQAKAKPAAEVKQERTQRLAAAATTRPGQTPPPKTVDDLSATELWNYMAAQREKDRAQRGY